MATKVSETSSVTKRLRPMASLREVEKEKSKADKASKEGRIKRTRHACVYCQHLKMRCSGPTEEGPCERCRRSGHECLVEERSPHRPWTKRKDAQIQQLTERLEEMENLLRLNSQSNASYNTAVPINETIPHSYDLPSSSYDHAQPILNETQNGNGSVIHEINNGVPNKMPYNRQNSTNQILPPGSSESLDVSSNIPNTKALDHVFGQFEASSVSPSSASVSRDVKFVQDNIQRLPFVSTYRLTPEEAVDLFHIFMNSCAMHTVILDPEWHTVESVGSCSTFLFGVVVYIGSTFHRTRRTVRKELENEMDTLIGRTITSGHKSVEIVQGFLLLYQWNLPADDPANDRAWLLAGIGIRLAAELQLYKSQKSSVASLKANTEEANFERINRERCWLMTFCVDRSLSMTAGRPWSMSENVRLVRDSDEWYSGPQTRSWDLGISALVSLMKLVSRQTDILNTTFFKSDKVDDHNDSNGTYEDFDCDSMMRIMNGELEHWRRQWYTRGFFTSPVERKDSTIAESPDNASPATTSSVDTNTLDIHTKTLHYITKQASLRFNFAVLVLNSFGLQYCAEKPSMIHTRTSCTARAIQAGQNLVKAAKEGMGKSMTYSPHTQYSIFGFGIISLIKLAPLVVDKVVCDRILDIVQTCITFLESVALTSDHTPARLASLSRTMLRKYEERKSMAIGGKRKHDGSNENGKRGAKKAKGSTGKNGSKEDQNDNQDRQDDENEGTQFAPNLDSFKLPQRSSRMVTPERGHVFAANEGNPNAAQILSSLGSSSHINSIGSNGAQNQPFSDPDMIPSNYLANAETDSLFQGIGIFETNDYSIFPQMTVEQILDSDFWLPISES